MQQELELFRVFLIHNKELVLQDALDAVACAVDLRDFLSVQRSADHAVGTGVDDCSRAAGLTENAGTD